MNDIKINNTPWTRLKDETTLAYSYFAVYRDLGPQRSYKKVQLKTNKKVGYIRQLETWSRIHLWVYRASLYDDHLDEKKLEFAEEGLKDLHNQAMNHAKKTLDTLIDIANGFYCEPYQLQAIELVLNSIGFIKKDPHLNKTIRDIENKMNTSLHF